MHQVARPRAGRGERAGDAGRTYRARPAWEAGGPQWDPYAPDQDRGKRVQAARQRQRMNHAPQQVTVESGNFEPSYYDILGVSPRATIAEIEAAYRRHAAQIHPDRFFDDVQRRTLAHEELKRLNSVMQVLRNPGDRAIYDARMGL